VFDILANGQTVYEEMGTSLFGLHHPLTIDIESSVSDSGELTIELRPADGSLPPILSGLQVIRLR